MKKIRPLLVVVLLSACTAKLTPSATVAFLSDFGLKDDSVAICKSVMWDINPHVKIVDITHDVPPYDIKTAGRFLANAARYFPRGTVFVAVVDPGVGSTRKAIAVRTKAGHFFVGPDNGIFTRVLADEGIDEARIIANPDDMRRANISSTFHGRDIFSPVGAHLASGTSFEQIGPTLAALVTLPLATPSVNDGIITGEVDYIEEPYGNMVSNIPAELIEKVSIHDGDALHVTVGARNFDLPFLKTFSDVPAGQVLAMISSRNFFYLAINQGHFARGFEIKPGDKVVIRKHDTSREERK